MTHVYRCTHDDCRRRVILARRVEKYFRKPKCHGCGREITGREDRALYRQRARETCTCDGYHFPHRRGSIWCNHSARRPTEQQYEQRFRGAPCQQTA